MNVDKTKYMVFGSKCMLTKIRDFDLKVNGQPLERVTSYHYLGVTLDPSLTFDKHITKLIGKVSDKVMQLKRMRMFLSSEAAVLVYKNMILPMIEYGDIFLTAASKENRGKLQVLQNKAPRAALQVDKYYDTADLHSEVGLSKLKTRREQHLLTNFYVLCERQQ